MLQEVLGEQDSSNSGYLSNEVFMRCLSKSAMKVTDHEVQMLVKELDNENQG